ncbi:MAG TPA: hypothetical protein VEI97_15990, partial [bacterium]|nr:hypothetical protein [bacterium]
FSAPAPEVAVTPMGLGPATRIDGIPNLTLLDTAPGADGTLVALYRDTTYQPWHRFIARRFDGTGSSTELFRSEGVYDDARVFTDLNDVPYFMYRRNGIEFLFETFLLNSWDPATNSLSYDIRIGHSQRRIEGELSGAVHFRPDPEGRSPMETVAVYVNRDRQIVAQSWDAGTPPPQIELPIGAAPHTYKPRLDTLQNRAGNIAVIWNLDHAQPASFQVGFLLGNTVVPGTYLADGLGIGMRLGVTGRDEFLAAYTTEPVAGAIQVLRFNPSGQSDYLATVDLSALGASIPGDNNRLAFATLANGKTILLALIDTLGDRELHAWDITDLGAIEDLGPFALGAEVPPTSITVRPDRRGNLHVVTVEGGSTFHRRFYWPRS